MRSLMTAAALVFVLSACASQATPPVAVPAPATAQAPAPAVKAPECYNGDAGKFEAIGTVSVISEVSVVCEKTSDGKNAQWMGVKK